MQMLIGRHIQKRLGKFVPVLKESKLVASEHSEIAWI